MRAMLVVTLVLVALLGACGARVVGNSPCEQVCVDLRDELIQNFGVAPGEIDCLDGGWSSPQTCDDCKRLIRDKYKVQMTGDDICRHF